MALDSDVSFSVDRLSSASVCWQHKAWSDAGSSACEDDFEEILAGKKRPASKRSVDETKTDSPAEQGVFGSLLL